MPATKEDRAYAALKRRILRMDFPAGEFLSQRKLADDLDMTVIPVREALRRLENDGLIESVPRWGVRIPAENREAIEDRYFVRETLEAAAARRLAAGVSKADAERLLELARACDGVEGDDEGAADRFAAAHLAFHEFVAGCARSPLLRKLLGQVALKSCMRSNARAGWSRGIGRGGRYHERLARALVDGTPAAAEKLMREHVRAGLAAELDALPAPGEPR